MSTEKNVTPEAKEKVDYTDSLPCRFIDEKRKAEIMDKAEEAELCLNESAKYLDENGIKCSTIKDVLEISVGNVKKFINGECEKFLKASSFIPREVQMETRQKYWNAFKELEPYASQIETIVEQYKDVKIVQDEDKSFHFDKETLSAYAEEKATIRTDKEQREAYRVYKKLYYAFIECNEWEKSHNWNEISVNGLIIPVCGEMQKVSIWNIMTGSLLGSQPSPLSPERFLSLCMHFIGRKQNVQN